MFLMLYAKGAAPTFISSQYVTTAGGNTFLVGSNFRIGMTVTVSIGGTTLLTNVVVPTDGGAYATCTLPTAGAPYASGNYNITVTNPDGQTVTGTNGFTVFAPSTIAGLMWDVDIQVGGAQSGGFLTGVTDQSSNAYALTVPVASSITYTASALNGYAAATGNGSTGLLYSTTNVTQATKATTVFMVCKVDATTSDLGVLFEQTNNSRATNSNGYRVEYKTLGPMLDISSGSSSISTINEVYTIVGASLNNGYAVYAFVFNRGATYPITIIGANPAYELTNVGGAFAGQGLISDGSSASNYDTSPLSFFARNNGANAATAASKMSLVRAFGYNTALSQTQIQNVVAALASQYGTNTSPATAQFMVIGDSIASVFDTNGSLSFSTYIYAAPNFYDNLSLDISAISGWTAVNAYANRVAVFTPRRSDVPCDAFIWLGTNDIASSDTLAPGDLYTNTLAPLIDYVHGLSGPAIRTILVGSMLPRGTVGSGTTATFEAKRVGKDTSGNPLPGWSAGLAVSSTTPTWLLISDGTHNQLMRCTTTPTGGVTGGSTPAWNFTLAATTTDNGGVWTCYGRPYNDSINDATNQSTHHYTAIDFGNPSTPLGTFSNTSNLTYYLSDHIHPQPTYQTGQSVPTSPSGPPFANSVLAYLVPFLKQGGTLTRTYRPPQIFSCTGLQSGSTNVAKGSPFYVSGQDFGELDASHPLTVSDGTNTFDCTNVTRISDVKLYAVAPAGIAVGGPYSVTYKRVDGLTATGGSLIIIPQPTVTGLAVGSLSSTTSETLPATTLNTFTVNIYISNGGGFGATAASLNGNALTGVTYSADGSVVTGTLPVGAYSAGTGNVTVTTPSSPTALANGVTFSATLDPSTIWPSNLWGWYRGDSLVGSGTATGWNDKSSHANNLGSIGGAPAINTASSNFQQNGTGIQTVTCNGSTDRFLSAAMLIGSSDPTAVTIGCIMQYGATSTNSGGMARFSGSGGAMGLRIVSSATKKPFLDVTWTITNASGISTPFLFLGHCNGLSASTGAMTINGQPEQTGSGTMTGSGIKHNGSFGIGYDTASSFCGGEYSEVIALNKEATTTEERQYAIYAHNYHGVTI